MKVNHNKSIRIVIAAALAAGMCQIASAVGLGPISVDSHIGEPLEASITVTGLSAAEAATTRVKVADVAAYQSRGIKKLPSHDSLKLSLSPSGSGYVINVRSNERIRDPFINFLLNMNSGGEEIIREYAVFLNPSVAGVVPAADEAVADLQAAAAPVQPTATNSRLLTLQPASKEANGWQGKAQQVPVARATTVQTGTYQGNTYGPVQKGETLFSIADKVRPSSDYPVQRAMRQIFNANRSAFGSSSLNSLYAGVTLQIPDFNNTNTASPQVRNTNRSVTPAKASEPVETPQPSAVSKEMDTPPVVQNDSTVTTNVPTETETVVEETENQDESTTPTLLLNDSPAVVDEVEQSDADAQPEEEIVATTDTSTANETTLYNEDNRTESSTDTTVEPTPITTEVTENPPQETEETVVVAEENTAPEITATPVQTTPPTVVTEANVPDPVADDDLLGSVKKFMNTTYAILPMWQWFAIAFAVFIILVILLLRSRSKKEIDEYEEDILDQNEMDAVLAQIHAFDETVVSDQKNDAQANSLTAEEMSSVESMFAEQDEFATDDDPLMSEDEFLAEEHPHSSVIGDDEESLDDIFADDLLAGIDDENINSHAFSGENSHNKPSFDDLDDEFDFLDTDLSSVGDDTLESEPTQSTPPVAESTAIADDVIEHEELNDEDWAMFDSLDELEAEAEETIQPVEVEKKPVPEKAIPEKKEPPVSSTSAPQVAAESKPSTHTHTEPDDMGWLDDLGLDDSENSQASAKTETKSKPAPAAKQVSSEEMEINLDLASSFIATGHGERAITWLEEVIAQGNDEQKARANELLTKVRGA